MFGNVSSPTMEGDGKDSMSTAKGVGSIDLKPSLGLTVCWHTCAFISSNEVLRPLAWRNLLT
jgi:hypothetical protein